MSLLYTLLFLLSLLNLCLSCLSSLLSLLYLISPVSPISLSLLFQEAETIVLVSAVNDKRDREGRNPEEQDREGRDQEEQDTEGRDPEEQDRMGRDPEEQNMDREARDQEEPDRDGRDPEDRGGRDQEDREGRDQEEPDREGRDQEEPDREGRDHSDQEAQDREGRDPEDREGRDQEDREGRDHSDQEAQDREGRDPEDREGRDPEDREGRDQEEPGTDQEAQDREGRDQEELDREGRDPEDREGRDQEDQDREGGRRRRFKRKFEEICQEDEDDMFVGLGYSKPPKKAAKSPQSRQANIGDKIRRTNRLKIQQEMNEKNEEIESLKRELKETRRELKVSEENRKESSLKIERTKKEIERVKNQFEVERTWIKPVFQSMPPTGRKIFKDSVLASRMNLPKGTMCRLREVLGINFHKALTVKQNEESELSKKIREFAINNSSDVPDTKACPSDASKPARRFAFHYRSVLHEAFMSEHPETPCSYSTFCQLWPSYVQRPNLADRGSCKCEVCENSEMLQEALKRNGLMLKEDDIFRSLKLDREEDSEGLEDILNRVKEEKGGERKDKVVIYKRWVQVEHVVEDESEVQKKSRGNPKKVPERRTFKATVARLVELFLAQVDELKDHLNRNSQIKKFIAQKKEEVMAEPNSVLMHIDWSECGTLWSPGMDEP
jgi:hypothetical protein